MNQKCKIVLIETDKAENCLILNTIKELVHYPNQVFTRSYLNSLNRASFHLYVLSDDKPKEGEYIPTYDEHSNKLNGVIKYDGVMGLPAYPKKIIATTNRSLIKSKNCECLATTPEGCSECIEKFPILSKDFIDKYCIEYNKSNKIEEILVEFIDNGEEGWSGSNESGEPIWNEKIELLVNPDNTINIKMIKDTWNREEVVSILHSYVDSSVTKSLVLNKIFHDQCNRWINQNL